MQRTVQSILLAFWFALCVAVPLPASGVANSHVANATATAPAKASEGKDFWDKLDAASGIISGILVALIGLYATGVYDRRQKEAEGRRRDSEVIIGQIQTVEKFLIHLSGNNEEMKRAALVAISALGNPKLAVDLSNAFSGPGATRALTDLASGVGGIGAAIASQSLLKILSPLQSRVASLKVGGKRRAMAFLVSSSHLATTAHALWEDDKPKKLEVVLGDRKLAVKVTHKDEALDLAILELDHELELTPIEQTTSEPTIGDAVTALQIDMNGSPILAFGRVKAVDVMRPGAATRFIVTDVTGFPGVSGAPVVNNEGQLLGMMHSVDPEGNQYLISADDLFGFVNYHVNPVE